MFDYFDTEILPALNKLTTITNQTPKVKVLPFTKTPVTTDQQIADEVATLFELIEEGYDRNSPEVLRTLASFAELCGGVYHDVCSICGSYPMTVNCNNAGCDI